MNAPSGCRYGTGFFGGKFLPFHKGHLDAIIRCASECEKLYVVLMHNSAEERQLLASYSLPFPRECLDVEVREHALRAEVRPLGNVEVLSYDCRPAEERSLREGKHPWFYDCVAMAELMGHFDVVYSSEPSYSELFERQYPWAEVAVLDADRERFPVSATMLRSMTFAEAYPYLPREYQKLINRKVLVTGPESGGKTQLVRKLAMILGTTHTVEVGRLYCERFSANSPGAAFYPELVFAQKEAERHAVESANMVAICDSDAITTAFYAEEYEHLDLEIAYAAARASGYDKVFFVEPTNPWVADGLRDAGAPEERRRHCEKMKRMYTQVGYELEILDGDYRSNYEEALASIRRMLGMKAGV